MAGPRKKQRLKSEILIFSLIIYKNQILSKAKQNMSPKIRFIMNARTIWLVSRQNHLWMI